MGSALHLSPWPTGELILVTGVRHHITWASHNIKVSDTIIYIKVSDTQVVMQTPDNFVSHNIKVSDTKVKGV